MRATINRVVVETWSSRWLPRLPASWDAFLTTNSSAAASSGSRMLSEVYSQALELGGNSFFLDAHGERVRGYEVLSDMG